MGATSKIEWTDATWNPVAGCSLVSAGCTNCYAMRTAHRLSQMGRIGTRYDGLTKIAANGKPVWTGVVRLNDAALSLPLTWRKPKRIFVNSMSDLFHEGLSDADIDRVFAVMALAPQHVFQVLTKRPERMMRYALQGDNELGDYFERLSDAAVAVSQSPCAAHVEDVTWPLPNVWLGVSIEDQATADARVPILLDTPAAVRFVSAEPLLGPIDMRPWLSDDDGCESCDDDLGMGGPRCSRRDLPRAEQCPRNFAVHVYTEHGPYGAGGEPAAITEDRICLDQVIVGGESGPGARPMHPDWARDLRDQCAAAGVPFFFKQWGAWAPGENVSHAPTRTERTATWWADRWHFDTLTAKASETLHCDDAPDLFRAPKTRHGRLLDGVAHDGMPAATGCRA